MLKRDKRTSSWQRLWSRGIAGLLCAAVLLLPTACGEDHADAEERAALQRRIDSINALNLAAMPQIQAKLDAARVPEVSYTPYAISSSADLKTFRNDYSKEQQQLILAFNRLDSRHLHYGDTLMIPEPLYTDLMPYTPFPRRIRELSFIPKFLMLSYRVQAYGAYEYGRLVRWGPTSLGKRKTPTPTGLFSVNWRSKKSISTIDSDWILPWNVNVMNFEGVSLHQYEMPGYPASHACARLLENDAKWVYYWAESWILTAQQKLAARGTPVLIFGSYDFGEPTPWSRLAQNPDILQLDALDLRPLRESIRTIIDWTITRDSVILEREIKKAARLKQQQLEDASAETAAGNNKENTRGAAGKTAGGKAENVGRDSSSKKLPKVSG